MGRIVIIFLFLFFVSGLYSIENGKFLLLGVVYNYDDKKDFFDEKMADSIREDIGNITRTPCGNLKDICLESLVGFDLKYKDGFIEGLLKNKKFKMDGNNFDNIIRNIEAVDNSINKFSMNMKYSIYSSEFMNEIKKNIILDLSSDLRQKILSNKKKYTIKEDFNDILSGVKVSLPVNFGMPYEENLELYKKLGITATIKLYVVKEEVKEGDVIKDSKVKDSETLEFEKLTGDLEKEINKITVDVNKLKDTIYLSQKEVIKLSKEIQNLQKDNIKNGKKINELKNKIDKQTGDIQNSKKKIENNEKDKNWKEREKLKLVKYWNLPKSISINKYSKDIIKKLEQLDASNDIGVIDSYYLKDEAKNLYALKSNIKIEKSQREKLMSIFDKVNYTEDRSIFENINRVEKEKTTNKKKEYKYSLKIEYYSFLKGSIIEREELKDDNNDAKKYGSIKELYSDTPRRINNYIYNQWKNYQTQKITKEIERKINFKISEGNKYIPDWIGVTSLLPGCGVGFFGLSNYTNRIYNAIGIEYSKSALLTLGFINLGSEITASILSFVALGQNFTRGYFYSSENAAIVMAVAIPFWAISFVFNCASLTLFINIKSITSEKIYQENLLLERSNFIKRDEEKTSLLNENLGMEISLGFKI